MGARAGWRRSFITMSPFWMIGVEALIPGGERLHGPTIFGMLVGLAGTALLGGARARCKKASAVRCCEVSCRVADRLLLAGRWARSCNGAIKPRRIRWSAARCNNWPPVCRFAVPAIVELRPHPLAWSARGIGAVAVSGGVRLHRRLQRVYLCAGAAAGVGGQHLQLHQSRSSPCFWAGCSSAKQIGLQEMIAMLIIFAGVALVKRLFRARQSCSAAEAHQLTYFSRAGSSLCGFVSTASNRSPMRSKRSIALWMLNCARLQAGSSLRTNPAAWRPERQDSARKT